MVHNRRRLLIASQQSGELPSGYTRLNYLESTGTQSIYLEHIVPDNTLETHITFAMSDITFDYSNNNRFVIAKYEGSNRRYRPIKITGSRQFSITNSNAHTLKTFNLDFAVHTVVFNNVNHYFSFDETLYNQSVIYTSLSGHNNIGLGVFAQSHATETPVIQADTTVPMKLYALSFYNNSTGNIIDDFVPCLDSNNVPCLYGLISKVTYYNAGSGTFLYG